MNTSGIVRALDGLGIEPVLVDLGASGEVYEVWRAISSTSVLVGFDPDSREMDERSSDLFRTHHIIPRAVTADENPTATFYLTRSPFCSSTLEPDHESLEAYLMAPLFEVESEVRVPASTLGRALEELGIERVDWFKADTQGTDLRIFRSLPRSIRDGVLAVDVEPGLASTYRGEDLFVETHAYLTSQGFWLSRLRVKGSARMTGASKSELDVIDNADETGSESHGVRQSPVWCEARYLRTAASLENREDRDWVLSWVFAMLDDQQGFAMDLVRGLEHRSDSPAVASLMRQETIESVLRRHELPALRRAWKRIVPTPLRKALFSARKWLSPDS